MDQRTRHSQHPTIRFARGTGFGATLVRNCCGLSGCWPPCTDLTGLPANGGFYFQAFDRSVALPVAGYNYNSVWTPLLAGLSPAGMAASVAALVLTVPKRLAKRLAKIARIRAVEPPIELAEFRYIQVWHPRMDSDPAHLWLRRMFAEAVVRD